MLGYELAIIVTSEKYVLKSKFLVKVIRERLTYLTEKKNDFLCSAKHAQVLIVSRVRKQVDTCTMNPVDEFDNN